MKKVFIRLAEDVNKNIEVLANIDVPMLSKSFGSATFDKLNMVSQII